MVRLKEKSFLYNPFTSGDFNSIMVRLKGMERVLRENQTQPFQFHYGTIKSETLEDKTAEYGLISIPLWYD